MDANRSRGDAQPDFETKSGRLPSPPLPVIFFHLFLCYDFNIGNGVLAGFQVQARLRFPIVQQPMMV